MLQNGSPEVARVRNQFEFEIATSFRNAAPLFGPEGERVWAGNDWNPQFVFPAEARDTEGMVFTVSHGAQQATWVNTVFDLDGGHMQYVYFVPDTMTTLIDVRLTVADPDRTRVSVTYERTALDPKANDHVRHMGTHDASAGAEWKSSIEAFLSK